MTIDDAYDEGNLSYWTGNPISANPCEEFSDEFGEWDSGWLDAQEIDFELYDDDMDEDDLEEDDWEV